MYFPRLTIAFPDTANVLGTGTPDLPELNPTIDPSPSGWEFETFDAIVIIPAFDDNPTVTVALVNHNGDTVYSIAGLADGATYYLQFSRKIQKGSYFLITLSAAPGSEDDITIDLGCL